jgi:hypothetical protein
MGMPGEAIGELQMAVRLFGWAARRAVANLARAYVAAGRKPEAAGAAGRPFLLKPDSTALHS